MSKQSKTTSRRASPRLSNHSGTCSFKYKSKQTQLYFSINTCDVRKHTQTPSMFRGVTQIIHTPWRGQCWSAEEITPCTPWCVCVCVCTRKRKRVFLCMNVCAYLYLYVHVHISSYVCLCAWLWKDRGSFNHFNSDHWEVKNWWRAFWCEQRLTKTEWVELDTLQTSVCLCKTQREKQRERLWQSDGVRGWCPHWSKKSQREIVHVRKVTHKNKECVLLL